MATKKRKKKGHYHRGEYTSKKTGQLCKHRSGWEHKYMVHLDSNPDVVEWSYEQIVIEYISNIRTKKIRRYHPDFYVKYSDGSEELLEVKPKRKLNQAKIKKKIDAALVWCAARGISYKIITEEELKSLDLI